MPISTEIKQANLPKFTVVDFVNRHHVAPQRLVRVHHTIQIGAVPRPPAGSLPFHYSQRAERTFNKRRRQQ